MAWNRWGLGLAVLVGTLAVSTSAQGAEVHVEPYVGQCGHQFSCNATVRYTAGPGEANALNVSRTPAGRRFQDDGAQVTAGRGCRSIDSHTVDCPGSLDDYVPVDMGDRDDHVGGKPDNVHLGPGDDTLDTAVPYASGGEGNDLLRGSNLDGGGGDDTLIGGPANDNLQGGPGADASYGGPGDDFFGAAERAATSEVLSPDLYDGGDGQDAVAYSSRQLAVAVDLESNPQGSPGEDDRFDSIESAIGGAGNDVIRGSAGPNVLDGLQGSDLIEGRAGDDSISGGADRDSVSGGPGDDRVESMFSSSILGGTGELGKDVGNEPVLCGPGRDLVERSNGDAIGPDCEHVDENLKIPYPRRYAKRSLALTAPCASYLAFRNRCLLTVRVRGTRAACPGVSARRRLWSRQYKLKKRIRVRVHPRLPHGCNGGQYRLRLDYRHLDDDYPHDGTRFSFAVGARRSHREPSFSGMMRSGRPTAA